MSVPITLVALCVHLLAGLGLVMVHTGTELNPSWESRRAWIVGHPWLWTGNWLLWMLASTSLLIFCLMWCRRLIREKVSPSAWLACAVVGAGVACDLTGEVILIQLAWTEPLTLDVLQARYQHYQWLSPCIANGLYCVAGYWLSWLSWRSGFLSGFTGQLGFVMWAAGMGLTLATLSGHVGSMLVTGSLVMVLFNVWLALLAWNASFLR